MFSVISCKADTNFSKPLILKMIKHTSKKIEFSFCSLNIVTEVVGQIPGIRSPHRLGWATCPQTPKRQGVVWDWRATRERQIKRSKICLQGPAGIEGFWRKEEERQVGSVGQPGLVAHYLGTSSVRRLWTGPDGESRQSGSLAICLLLLVCVWSHHGVVWGLCSGFRTVKGDFWPCSRASGTGCCKRCKTWQLKVPTDLTNDLFYSYLSVFGIERGRDTLGTVRADKPFLKSVFRQTFLKLFTYRAEQGPDPKF